MGLRRCLLLCALLATGCTSSGVVGQAPGGAAIIRIPLRLSNVHVIRTRTPVLIDSGTIGDMPDLQSRARRLRREPAQHRLVVLTHGPRRSLGARRRSQSHDRREDHARRGRPRHGARGSQRHARAHELLRASARADHHERLPRLRARPPGARKARPSISRRGASTAKRSRCPVTPQARSWSSSRTTARSSAT